MEVTFLGTGTSGGVPLIGCQCPVCKSADSRDKRLRTSALIKINGLNIIIDCGPDFRQQLLREDIRKVDALLMTHPHKDHTGGFDDIRSLNYMTEGPVDVYCNELTEEGIREQYIYAFKQTDYPYLPKMNFIRIEKEHAFDVKGVNVIPAEVIHGGMPVLGFRLGDFAYITDAKTVSKEERDKLRGTKTLVVNALRYNEHYSHFTVDEALAFIEDIKPERAYLTHMSHQFGLHAEMEQKLPTHVKPAYDGLKIVV
jgi:phosphoribosyl 1,2-cyclic phosphate phosphodiesterase